MLAVEDERHGDDGLQGVALCAPRRGDVSLAARDPDREVQHAFDRRRRQARAVVAYGDPGGVHRDPDRRCNAGFLAGVNGVVGQLLDDDERPLLALVAGLGDAFDQAIQAAIAVLKWARPEVAPVEVADTSAATQRSAEQLLHDVVHAPSILGPDDRLQHVRRLLGPRADRRTPAEVRRGARLQTAGRGKRAVKGEAV